jgi:hypothetical protein
MEHCAICLLNLGEWEYLIGLEKRWIYFEIAAAVANACLDTAKYKGNKKVSREAWDIGRNMMYHCTSIFIPTVTKFLREILSVKCQQVDIFNLAPYLVCFFFCSLCHRLYMGCYKVV